MAFVKDIMTRDAVSISKTKKLHDLISLMSKGDTSCVFVMDKSKVIGLVTERDLIRKVLLPKKSIDATKIEDIMSAHLVGIEPEASIIEANHTMRHYKIRHLPVMKDGTLRGMVTLTDLAREAGEIDLKNKTFMTYQNIQSAIIVCFFVFLAFYAIHKIFSF